MNPIDLHWKNWRERHRIQRHAEVEPVELATLVEPRTMVTSAPEELEPKRATRPPPIVKK